MLIVYEVFEEMNVKLLIVFLNLSYQNYI